METENSPLKTRLSCGHLYNGVHLGPNAWCIHCLDFVWTGNIVKEKPTVDGDRIK